MSPASDAGFKRRIAPPFVALSTNPRPQGGRCTACTRDQAALSRRTGHLSQADWTTRELLALAAMTHADHQVQNALQRLSF
jgi:hypothetical protein